MNTYTKKERNMYLIGLMGQNVIYNIIATGMVFYFQSVIFIPAIAISVIMGVARIWHAINDPMIPPPIMIISSMNITSFLLYEIRMKNTSKRFQKEVGELLLDIFSINF